MSVTAVASAQPTGGAWAGTTLEPKGWTYLGYNDHTGLVVYVRRYRPSTLRPPGPFPRIWLRWEYAAPQAASPAEFRSEIILVDVDCAQSRMRGLQQDRFAGNNLAGALLSISAAKGDWQDVAPNTLNSATMKIVCGAS